MRQIFDRVQFLVGNENVITNMKRVPVLPLFSPKVLDFLSDLSCEIMEDSQAKQYPDVISIAFWLRRAHMKKVSETYRSQAQKIGRGMVFHIAPSNIPVQFVVSLVYALTAGNASVVRVSDKNFPQINIFCQKINELLNGKWKDFKPYICVIRYGHDVNITQYLTNICDVRLIWGGDNTVNSIRNIAVPPRCIDLGFADRYSIAVFDSEAILHGDKRKIAEAFYNDTYFVDQNACSSPRIIVWLGKNISKSKEIFWNELEKIVKRKYSLNPISASNKLLNTALFAAIHDDSREVKNNNYIVRLEVKKLSEDIMDYKENAGYFFEYNADSIIELIPILNKKCQTVVFIGNIENEIRETISNYGVRGVDRIVPVGNGTNISFVWDGLDLPNVLSRQIGKH